MNGSNLLFVARKSSIDVVDDYEILNVLIIREYFKAAIKAKPYKQKFSAFAICQALTDYHGFEYLITLLFSMVVF